MGKLSLEKSEWLGNHWPSVDILDPYRPEDFLKVLGHLCVEFSVPVPPVVDIVDGYAADLCLERFQVKLLLDHWTFSIATEDLELRDEIFTVLGSLEV